MKRASIFGSLSFGGAPSFDGGGDFLPFSNALARSSSIRLCKTEPVTAPAIAPRTPPTMTFLVRYSPFLPGSAMPPIAAPPRAPIPAPVPTDLFCVAQAHKNAAAMTVSSAVDMARLLARTKKEKNSAREKPGPLSLEYFCATCCR